MLKPTCLLALWSCSTTADNHPDAAPSPDAPPPPTLTIAFERAIGSRDFDVIATSSDGSPITLEVDRGTLAGNHVTTAGTGHYVVTARTGDVTLKRTALVLGTVDDAWGQPEPVPGLVNTVAWEDGPSISPDGKVLTVQYLPISINCYLDGFDVTAERCKIIGPVAAPARPDMPGANRVKPDGHFTNDCPSVGLPELPGPVAPNSVYGFSRQADGSFTQPRPIYFEGIDGCFSSFGFELQDSAGTAVYSFDDPRPPYTGGELFAATVDVSKPVVLGTWSPSPTEGFTMTGHVGTSIGMPADGHEGNPHVKKLADGKRIILFDDEANTEDLFFLEETATGWGPKKRIPAPVSVAGEGESQPFFDGQTLLFRRDSIVLGSTWSGGAMDLAASWSPVKIVLAPSTSSAAGEVIVIGEPSVTKTGARELYFIYAMKQPDGSLNLDVGRVPAR